jgi:hypothetical protein
MPATPLGFMSLSFDAGRKLPWSWRFPYQSGPQAASHVGQDDRSRLGINAARFLSSFVQLRPAARRVLGRGV